MAVSTPTPGTAVVSSIPSTASATPVMSDPMRFIRAPPVCQCAAIVVVTSARGRAPRSRRSLRKDVKAGGSGCETVNEERVFGRIPPAAEGLDQTDAGAHLEVHGLRERQLVGQERPLGVDDDEVVGQALLVL